MNWIIKQIINYQMNKLSTIVYHKFFWIQPYFLFCTADFPTKDQVLRRSTSTFADDTETKLLHKILWDMVGDSMTGEWSR